MVLFGTFRRVKDTGETRLYKKPSREQVTGDDPNIPTDGIAVSSVNYRRRIRRKGTRGKGKWSHLSRSATSIEWRWTGSVRESRGDARGTREEVDAKMNGGGIYE